MRLTRPDVSFRSTSETVIGVLYALGALHQGVFVLRSSRDFYQTMADRAWIEPAERFVDNFLTPNSAVVTVSVVAFQGALAVAILTRSRYVAPALLAGGVFSLMGAFTGDPGETVGYALLAGLHIWLAATHEKLPAHQSHKETIPHPEAGPIMGSASKDLGT